MLGLEMPPTPALMSALKPDGPDADDAAERSRLAGRAHVDQHQHAVHSV